MKPTDVIKRGEILARYLGYKYLTSDEVPLGCPYGWWRSGEVNTYYDAQNKLEYLGYTIGTTGLTNDWTTIYRVLNKIELNDVLIVVATDYVSIGNVTLTEAGVEARPNGLYPCVWRKKDAVFEAASTWVMQNALLKPDFGEVHPGLNYLF